MRKSKRVIVPVDEELHAEMQQYAKKNGTTVVAVTRAMWRWLTGKGDEQELPPGIESDEEARKNRHQYRQDVE